MSEMGKQNVYDLEARTLNFAKDVVKYVNALPKTVTNIEIGKQLVRSGGSVGANYIEANEALGKKDFVMHAKISRKEAKESRYWLSLSEPRVEEAGVRNRLISEATELVKIFNAIVMKST